MASIIAQGQAATQPAQTFSLAGIVVNSLTGQPVPSASVAIAPTNQGADREISRSMTTGADGRFTFAQLRRGKYSLMAMARGYTLQYFDHHDPYATAIAVGPELDTEHLTFRLQPDASLEGVVTDESNEPVQNAMVRVFQTSTEGGQRKTLPGNQAQTDDQGHYHLGHLAPGSYYLAVSARPWYAQNTRAPRASGNPRIDEHAAQEAAILDVTYPLTFYPDASDSAQASPIELAPGEKSAADVVMRAIPALHLRIRTPGAAENDVLGRMVFPHVSQRIFEGYLDAVFNAPDSWAAPGVIEISGLAPGHYVIEMSPSTGLGEKTTTRGWYKEIDLTSDTEVSASDGPAFAKVGGTVLFEDPSQVPRDASLQLSNPDTGETFRSDIADKGVFDFNGDEVRPGRYQVAVENANGFFLKRLSATGAKVSGRTIEIGNGGVVRISAMASRGAGRIEGTVIREGEPFAGAMVVLVPQDPANNAPLFRRDQSDSDGTFTLTNVVPGEYTAIALANGWDLEWANPSVLQPYLKLGGTVQVQAEGKLQIKVELQ
jgi:5-hydroxyisourate hydrolase-like protein (transthyretin family)